MIAPHPAVARLQRQLARIAHRQRPVLADRVDDAHPLVGEDGGVEDLVVQALAGGLGAGLGVGQDVVAAHRRRVGARGRRAAGKRQLDLLAAVDLLVLRRAAAGLGRAEQPLAAHHRLGQGLAGHAVAPAGAVLAAQLRHHHRLVQHLRARLRGPPCDLKERPQKPAKEAPPAAPGPPKLAAGAGLAPEHRRQVEAEAVDAVARRPVAQAVGDQADHRRAGGIERVAAAGVVDVQARLRGVQAVIGGVVEAAEREGRAEGVGLAGVVEDDVEEGADAGVAEEPATANPCACNPASISAR